MKVEMYTGGKALLIIPETEFETEWLLQFGKNESCEAIFSGFHKYGASRSDYLGLKIDPSEVVKNDRE